MAPEAAGFAALREPLRKPLPHSLPKDATLADAAALFGGRTALASIDVTGPDGDICGHLSEDDLRLGLAGRSRPHHRVQSLMRSGAYHAAEPASRQIRRALVMAGGRGSRLSPLTDATPKPLLPIDGTPLLHRILRQLSDAGIEQCWISLLYLGDQIEESIGDGSAFGLDVQYVRETTPLGTAGALGLLPASTEATANAIAVMNGDVFHEVNLRALFAWHRRHHNQATVATQLHEVYVPFGLAHFDGQKLERLEEKPTLRLPVNAGIYVFDEALLTEIARGEPWDMVDWLNQLAKRHVAGQFPVVERWHDIGSLDEYRSLCGT